MSLADMRGDEVKGDGVEDMRAKSWACALVVERAEKKPPPDCSIDTRAVVLRTSSSLLLLLLSAWTPPTQGLFFAARL